MKASVFAVLAAALALAAAGCGTTTLDTAQVEDDVTERAEDRDLQVDNVTCPDEIEAQEGDEFECDIELEGGQEIEAEVIQRNDDGDYRIRIDRDQLAQAQGQDDPGANQGDSQDAQLVEQAIRSFVQAARDGDAATFCGQQSDPRLERRYGGIQACVRSEEATTPVSSIPRGDELQIEITSLTPPTASVQVGREGGSATSTYEMVDEGGEGGWAVESIDGE